MPKFLTAEERKIVYEIDWQAKHDDAVARLAKLEHFEAALFDRLNEADLPEDNRDRITDEDGGLLTSVQAGIRRLIRSLPLLARNVELTAKRREQWKALEAARIHALCGFGARDGSERGA